MIKSIKIKDKDNTAVSWLPKIDGFKESFEFTPGLNILFGLNGSGKSSLLTLIARMFHCEQGQDEQKVTSYSFSEMFSLNFNNPGLSYASKYDAVSIVHDGSPVVYLSPNKVKGQIHAGSFDDDFFKDSVQSYMFKGSSGETTIRRLGPFLKKIDEGSFKKIPKIERHDEGKEIINSFLAGTLEKDRPTVILDEPEKSLDVMAEMGLWEFIKAQRKVQMIISTHSLFACDIPEANYIVFGDRNYLENCRIIKKDFGNGR